MLAQVVECLDVLGLRRDRERMRGPDVCYIRSDKLGGMDAERFFRGAPDLAIEIDLTSGEAVVPGFRLPLEELFD